VFLRRWPHPASLLPLRIDWRGIPVRPLFPRLIHAPSTAPHHNLMFLVWFLLCQRIDWRTSEETAQCMDGCYHSVEEMADRGGARGEEEVEDVRDVVREDPIELPSIEWNDWDQNAASDSEWARMAGYKNGSRKGENEGRVRRGSLNRSRELHGNQDFFLSPHHQQWSVPSSSPSSSSSL
ncbi:hypothetical protein PMAYCL1PPCAC_17668, partial [Pristionchus mayeri]